MYICTCGREPRWLWELMQVPYNLGTLGPELSRWRCDRPNLQIWGRNRGENKLRLRAAATVALGKEKKKSTPCSNRHFFLSNSHQVGLFLWHPIPLKRDFFLAKKPQIIKTRRTLGSCTPVILIRDYTIQCANASPVN
jgi:hypothetical protein